MRRPRHHSDSRQLQRLIFRPIRANEPSYRFACRFHCGAGPADADRDADPGSTGRIAEL